MKNIGDLINTFYEQNILAYIQSLQEYPIKFVSLILDITIVVFLAYELIKIVKVIFQPEIRRALEQLGGNNRFSRFFGFDKDIITRTKEDIYKVVIAAFELAKTHTGALIVIERDIKLSDIIATGIQ